MKITEIRVKLSNGDGKCLAFCTICLDGAVVINDVKIIQGMSGPFVAMPSRKLTDHCPSCSCKNHVRARYCNFCGDQLDENRAPVGEDGRPKLHFDVAHPVTKEMRDTMEKAIIDAYKEALG